MESAPPKITKEERLAEAILEELGVRLGHLPLSADVRDELVAEARPAVHALLFALGTDRAADVHSLEHHESMAMLTLLGRSVGLHGVTPSAAIGIVPALTAAFEAHERALPVEVATSLTAVLMEGFVRGREEATREAAHAALDASQAPRSLAEGVLMLSLVGPLESDAIVKHGEELARVLFKTEARACLVDVAGLNQTSARHARAVLCIDESARMLGVRCVFTGFDERWCDALIALGLEPPEGQAGEEFDTAASTAHALIERVEPFGAALKVVYEAAGYQLVKGKWLPGPLRALLS